MSDVAAEAQVSAATVSLVLSGDARISAATRHRVMEVVNRLGYRRSAAARSLRTATTGTLGLILGDVANPFFGELASAAERAAALLGHTLILGNADERTDKQDQYLQMFLDERRVDGVMLVSAAGVTPGLARALHQRQRVVLVDRPLSCAGIQDQPELVDLIETCPLVRADGHAAIAEAATDLVAWGHRRFGVITGPLTTEVGRERRDAFVDTVQRLGGGEFLIAEGNFRARAAEHEMRVMLDADRPPTAVFCADGLMTQGALYALQDRGMSVPRDISLLGYDDSPWFELVTPAISTISQPVARIGRSAVRHLVAEGGRHPRRFQCRYVRRGSCGPAQPGTAGARRSANGVTPAATG